MPRILASMSSILLSAILLFGCARSPAPPTSPEVDPGAMAEEPQDDAPIGSATMLDDGTLVLSLRAETGSSVGHAQFTYSKDHPKYAETLAHIGDIEPGQDKLVRPFPPAAPSWTYQVSRNGIQLGTIEVPPGKIGSLQLKDGLTDNEDALALKTLWTDVQTSGRLRLKIHKPQSDGSRGPLVGTTTSADDPSYGESVHWWLLDKGYGVHVLSSGDKVAAP